MAQVETARATVADLYREPGKAELVGGRIVRSMPTGAAPGQIGLRIARSLDEYTEAVGAGDAYPDNVGFVVPELPSGRESFSPDAAFHPGPKPENPMRFVEGPPALAVEVRSENDYGPRAEDALAGKRADYFAAGTQVVWDVDPLDERIDVYRLNSPEPEQTYRRGDIAAAEPAVPGWRVSVDWIFQ